MSDQVPFGLSRNAVAQLITLQRRPIETPSDNQVLRQLYSAGFVSCAPLLRPSGKPTRYREWAITDDGRMAIDILKELR